MRMAKTPVDAARSAACERGHQLVVCKMPALSVRSDVMADPTEFVELGHQVPELSGREQQANLPPETWRILVLLFWPGQGSSSQFSLLSELRGTQRNSEN